MFKRLTVSIVLLLSLVTSIASAQKAYIIQQPDGTYLGIAFLPSGQQIVLTDVTLIKVPDPTPTPPPPVTAGKRDIVIIRESATQDAKMASAQTLLQSNPEIVQWKQAKGHRVIYLDPNDKDETGTRPSPVLTRYTSLLPAGQQFPAIVIIDRESGAVRFVGNYDMNWKASDIVELAKKHGG